MKIINQTTLSAVFVLIFTLMLSAAPAVQTNETVFADDSVVKGLTASTQISKKTSKLQTINLVEESVFHRFIKRGKGYLSLIGQRLSFVFANLPFDNRP